MRLLHTADWQLGRLFHQTQLTDDQQYLLGQFVDLARDVRPDLVVVAGDVYDRAVPPPDAVDVLDEVLSRLVLDLRLPVVVIAGNHDSPRRLSFGSRLLAAQGLHVVGRPEARPYRVDLADDHGPVAVHALPFCAPAAAAEALEDEGVHDQQGVLQAMVERARTALPTGARSVLVAHAFVAGGAVSESERPLSVGGVATVDPAVFTGFDYVALGHLHRPQSLVEGRVQYAGSLLKYSFDEVAHEKSVNLVEIDGAGGVRTERVRLSPRRDVRRLEGLLADLLASPDERIRDDYLCVSLLDRGPVLDAIGRLRRVYPNVLHIERPLIAPEGKGIAPGRPGRKTEVELFDAFFRDVTGDELNSDETRCFADTVDDLLRAEREATA